MRLLAQETYYSFVPLLMDLLVGINLKCPSRLTVFSVFPAIFEDVDRKFTREHLPSFGPFEVAYANVIYLALSLKNMPRGPYKMVFQ